ncbi:hypothetical protein EBR21_12110 [bacterium]|nr:hypothetical protein [bacterium]
MKLAAVRVNLEDLWNRVKDDKSQSISIDPNDELLGWKNYFNTMVIKNSIRTFEKWRTGNITAVNNFDTAMTTWKSLANAQTSFDLSQTNGLNEIIDATPFANVDKMLELARWYSNIDNPLLTPLTAASPSLDVARNLDIETWKKAVKSVYEKESTLYKGLGLNLVRTTQVTTLLSSSWTADGLANVHGTLGLATERKWGDSSLPQLRLAVVMSVYGRMINSRVNVLARVLDDSFNAKSTPQEVGERIRKVFFKKGRIGPGNAVVFSEEQRVFLPVAGGFPFTMNFEIDALDTDYDDTLIKYGSERQATIIGKLPSGKFALLMTLRFLKMSTPDTVNKTFDLSTWTRDFSVSMDSGKTWSPDGQVKPTYTNNMVEQKKLDDNSDQPQITKYGFESSEIQGSVASVPNFFGEGRPLVLHLHPQNNSLGIVKDKDGKSKVVTCLGASPGDVSNTAGSKCDYRMNLTLVPGIPNSNLQSLDVTQSTASSSAVDWKFDDRFVAQPGSASYSAITYIGRDNCDSVKVGYIYEGTADDSREFEGFNNGIMVGFVKIKNNVYGATPVCNLPQGP